MRIASIWCFDLFYVSIYLPFPLLLEQVHWQVCGRVNTEIPFVGISTHFKLTLFLIFLRRLSFVTNSSMSSLSAKYDGGSLISRLTQSCFITSSTVSVASMRVRTVRPSPVVTLFVGTRALLFPPLADEEGPKWLRALAEFDIVMWAWLLGVERSRGFRYFKWVPADYVDQVVEL